mmetsp:Transcript_38862/g.107046  ORF Transcript_38862/g.107046 Transcript_38862/m.107046 type:complete len:229 (-) Transcript_38862:393-1079(-)
MFSSGTTSSSHTSWAASSSSSSSRRAGAGRLAVSALLARALAVGPFVSDFAPLFALGVLFAGATTSAFAFALALPLAFGLSFGGRSCTASSGSSSVAFRRCRSRSMASRRQPCTTSPTRKRLPIFVGTESRASRTAPTLTKTPEMLTFVTVPSTMAPSSISSKGVASGWFQSLGLRDLVAGWLRVLPWDVPPELAPPSAAPLSAAPPCLRRPPPPRVAGPLEVARGAA